MEFEVVPPKFDGKQSLEELQVKWLLPKIKEPVPKLAELPEINLDISLGDIDTYLSDPLLVCPSDGSITNSASSYAGSAVPRIVDVELKRHGRKVVGYQEVSVSHVSSATSTSHLRSLGGDFICGSSAQLPFTPGGLNLEPNTQSFDVTSLLDSLKHLGEVDQLPGFERGLLNKQPQETSLAGSKINLAQILAGEDYQLPTLEPTEKPGLGSDKEPGSATKTNLAEDLDCILNEGTTLPHPETKPNSASKKWAFEVNLNRLPLDYNTVVPQLAHQFPFELDLFQKHAVYHLESGNSVFIAAHTSAGKTVVAEYAIALAAQHMTRVIYTSPIKALSNQKFRDFATTFPEVGLLTGDVQIQPEASCLIMTTEILRSMLYRGADLIRDVEFVIFDEIHYLNDADRGVVWEEVIIMLPPHVTLILLSATVPNTMEFAEWIGRTKQSNIFVISTKQRPVPLEHYLYFNKELFKVVDHKGTFIESSIKACKNSVFKDDKPKPKPAPKGSSVAGNNAAQKLPQAKLSRNTTNTTNNKVGFSSPQSNEKKEQMVWVTMINFLKKQKLLPVIIFTFSKRLCDQNSGNLPSIDLNTATEKAQVKIFMNRSLRRLAEADRELPQILRLQDLLLRGIAVHHSGLLPIIKEMVEILFSKNLVKVLFATETFAMGVNMPARSVVFNGLRKHDGQAMRYLLPGEYTQMSGRAGRRGLDSVGMVIIMSQRDGPYDTSTLRHLILGKSTKLSSQFRLTYNMILNLLRVEALKVEEMIQRSFAENSSQQMLPQHMRERDNFQRQLDALPSLDCSICKDSIDRFLTASTEFRQLGSELSLALYKANRDILCPGRVVVVDTTKYRNCLASILKPASNSENNLLSNTRPGFYHARSYLCYVLVDSQTKNSSKDDVLPYHHLQHPHNPHHALVSVSVSDMIWITPIILKPVRSQNIQDEAVRIQIRDDLVVLSLEWSDFHNIPYIPDRPKNLDITFFDQFDQREFILNRLANFPCRDCPEFISHYRLAYQHRHLETLKLQLNESIAGVNLELLPEYYQRLDVLHLLNHAEQLTITLKGRIACEISAVNELVLTELLLDNFFGPFTPEESVALLSSFLCHDKSPLSLGNLETGLETRLTENLVEGCNKIIATCLKIAEAQHQCGMVLIDPESYCQQEVNFGLVGPVYEWARGMSFKQITTLTEIAEGSIVRCITRLDDTCRDVRNAARLIGDSTLYTKMEEARLQIQRDIVFAASLYL